MWQTTTGGFILPLRNMPTKICLRDKIVVSLLRKFVRLNP